MYVPDDVCSRADIAMRISKEERLLLSFFSSSRYPRHLFYLSENKTVRLYLVQLIAVKEIQQEIFLSSGKNKRGNITKYFSVKIHHYFHNNS